MTMVKENKKAQPKYTHVLVDRNTHERIKELAQGMPLTTFLREHFLIMPERVARDDIARLDEKIEKMQGFIGWGSIPESVELPHYIIFRVIGSTRRSGE